MLKFLGKFGKGIATVVGIGTAAGGAAINLSVDPSVNEALARLSEILVALGAILAAFGIGRKAGYAVK